MKYKNIFALVFSIILISLSAIWIMKHQIKPLPNDTLIVGTNAEFPPYTYINDKGEIVGFDIDIAKEVAHRLGKKIEIKDMSFDGLIPEITRGSIQVIAAGMTATPERAQRIIFTKPYLKGEFLVVITLKQHPITKIEDLKGKEVVVNEGYTADSYISAIPGIEVKRLPTPIEAMLDLETGKSYAYVSAFNAAKPYLATYGMDKFNIFTIQGTDENTAMGISQKYPELLNQIQPILDAMEADGTIEKLKKKWGLSS